MIFSIKPLIASQIKQCYGYILVIQFGYNSHFLFCYESSWDEITQDIFQNELKILFFGETEKPLKSSN